MSAVERLAQLTAEADQLADEVVRSASDLAAWQAAARRAAALRDALRALSTEVRRAAASRARNRDATERPLRPPGRPCPSCRSGTLEIRFRHADSAPFWGCSAYPDCTFTAPCNRAEHAQWS